MRSDHQRRPAADRMPNPEVLMIRVMVGKYTYETDLPVEVGSVVVLPPGQGPGEWTGTVTSLETTYDGPCKRIVRLLTAAEVAAAAAADAERRKESEAWLEVQRQTLPVSAVLRNRKHMCVDIVLCDDLRFLYKMRCGKEQYSYNQHAISNELCAECHKEVD